MTTTVNAIATVAAQMPKPWCDILARLTRGGFTVDQILRSLPANARRTLEGKLAQQAQPVMLAAAALVAGAAMPPKAPKRITVEMPDGTPAAAAPAPIPGPLTAAEVSSVLPAGEQTAGTLAAKFRADRDTAPAARRVRTLKPGLLVALKTSVDGGVSYARRDVDRNQEGQVERSSWYTEKVVVDKAEHDAAKVARSAARYAISRICSNTSFGLLCPIDREDDLWAAVAEATKVVQEHNKAAKATKVYLYVLPARIAQDNEQAERAINAEVSSLLAEMRDAMQAADVEKIREAANRARDLEQMLSVERSKQVSEAVQAARAVAKAVAASIRAGGEDASAVLNAMAKEVQAVEAAQVDFSAASESAIDATAAVDASDLDLSKTPAPAPAAPAAPAPDAEPALDLAPAKPADKPAEPGVDTIIDWTEV